MGQTFSKRYWIQKRWRDKNKDFLKKKNRAWYLAHRDEVLSKAKRNRKAEPEKYRVRGRKAHRKGFYRKYLSKTERKKVILAFAKFRGKCEICSTGSPGKNGWNVDHNHKTGKFRGILCSPCNAGLGFFRDNKRILKKAINYLAVP